MLSKPPRLLLLLHILTFTLPLVQAQSGGGRRVSQSPYWNDAVYYPENHETDKDSHIHRRQSGGGRRVSQSPYWSDAFYYPDSHNSDNDKDNHIHGRQLADPIVHTSNEKTEAYSSRGYVTYISALAVMIALAIMFVVIWARVYYSTKKEEGGMRFYWSAKREKVEDVERQAQREVQQQVMQDVKHEMQQEVQQEVMPETKEAIREEVEMQVNEEAATTNDVQRPAKVAKKKKKSRRT